MKKEDGMKRQNAEEYTQERVRKTEISGKEPPIDTIKRLMGEASEIADANNISFLAATKGGVDLSGNGGELLKLAMVAAAYVAVEVGSPEEEFEKYATMLIRPAYEVAKEI